MHSIIIHFLFQVENYIIDKVWNLSSTEGQSQEQTPALEDTTSVQVGCTSNPNFIYSKAVYMVVIILSSCSSKLFDYMTIIIIGGQA